MRPTRLESYTIPFYAAEDLSAALDGGDRVEGNLELLRSKSLGSREISPGMTALLVIKSRPYATGPGLDNMLLITKKDALVSGVDDLQPGQLDKILIMANEVENIYERVHVVSKPGQAIEKKVVAINYHKGYVAPDKFGKKLHVQTLNDLHIHVSAFMQSEFKGRKMGRNTPDSSSELTRTEWDDINDPGLRLTKSLLQIPSLRQGMSQGLHILSLVGRAGYEGINFEFATEGDSLELARDIIQLHHNAKRLYEDIHALFTDGNDDSSDMPALFPPEKRLAMIQTFTERLARDNPDSILQIRRLAEKLEGWSKLLKSGEEIKDEEPKLRSPRIFLKNFAYTMSLITDAQDKGTIVNLSPRIFSTGNVLATLGLHKVLGPPPPEEYIQQRKNMHQALVKEFSPAHLSEAGK